MGEAASAEGSEVSKRHGRKPPPPPQPERTITGRVVRPKQKKQLPTPVVDPKLVAGLSADLKSAAEHGTAATMAGVQAGLKLMEIRDRLKSATRPGKPHKDGRQTRLPDKGAWTRWLESPASPCHKRWAFTLIELAERWQVWCTAVHQKGSSPLGPADPSVPRINPAALDKASAGIAQIQAGDVGVRSAIKLLPPPEYATPVTQEPPVDIEAAASDREARALRLAEVSRLLASTPLALRGNDLKELAKDDEGVAVAAVLADVYVEHSGLSMPNLTTARAVALLDPDVCRRLAQTPLATRPRDLVALSQYVADAAYTESLLEIIESGARVTLKGAMDLRQSRTQHSSCDRGGTWIPPRLRWLLAELPDMVRSVDSHARGLRTAIKRAMAMLEEAHKRGELTAKELSPDVSAMFSQRKVDAVSEIIDALAWIQHDGICPDCKADSSIQCRSCGGCGWVSRSRRKMLERDAKDRADLEAKA